MMKKYGYIYKITHIPSGRYYIGQKTGDNPEGDGYMGSGTVWKLILKKHKNIEFRKDVLAFAYRAEELNELEKYYIGDLYITDDLCQNLCEGGGGCSGYKYSEEAKEKIRKANIGEKNPSYGKHPSEETRRKMSAARRGKKRGPMSEEQKQKISETRKLKGVASGKNNPNYGKRLSKEARNKMSELFKGKKHPEYGMHWFTNGKENILAFESPEGFYQGRTTGKHWFTNGKENVFTIKCPKGFTKGRVLEKIV